MLSSKSHVLKIAMLILIWCVYDPQIALGQDFSRLTALSNAALLGIGIDEPVAGFEIRVMQQGEVLYHEAFGNWSIDQLANTDSSTKTLSGALMMSLAEAGTDGFSLDSQLADYLVAFDKPEYRDITIRQAFSHTSGLPGEDVGSAILASSDITLRQAAFLISQIPLETGPPGTEFSYGGLSMQAAGAAAEIAFGQSYLDMFNDRIAIPLGMTNTNFVIASDSNPRVAGGVESTASDYSRFMDMLLNDGIDRVTGNRILSSASVAEMLTRQTNDQQLIANSPTFNSQYGIGVWLDQYGEAGPPIDALAGGARGFHSWIDQENDLVFTFATDLTSFANIQPLAPRMHLALLNAIVPEPNTLIYAFGMLVCPAFCRS